MYSIRHGCFVCTPSRKSTTQRSTMFKFCLVFAIGLLPLTHAVTNVDEAKCNEALERFVAPDITYTAKHLWSPCGHLCANSSGQFPTGQFPHPWDCNAFINCYENDAWVHWCQQGLHFNENNMQCDYPKNVNCVTKPKQTPSPNEKILIEPDIDTEVSEDRIVVTCKDSNTKLNEREFLGIRPDLCKDGTGNYRAPDCRFYIRCTGTKAYVARCPAGFLFDHIRKQCDWPSSNPICLQSCADNYDTDQGRTNECLAPSTEKTTTKPVSTTTAKPLKATTLSPEEKLDVANLACNDSHCIPKAGCQPELCKQPIGQFAFPGDCTKFANCWKSCAYINKCPLSMVFTETKGMCDVPWNLAKDHPCYSVDGSGVLPQINPVIGLENNNNFEFLPQKQYQNQNQNMGSMSQSQSQWRK